IKRLPAMTGARVATDRFVSQIEGDVFRHVGRLDPATGKNLDRETAPWIVIEFANGLRLSGCLAARGHQCERAHDCYERQPHPNRILLREYDDSPEHAEKCHEVRGKAAENRTGAIDEAEIKRVCDCVDNAQS